MSINVEEEINKKVKNAKKVYFNDILFKSKLELSCYKKLLNAGFEAKYEPFKFVLQNGVKLNHVTYYSPIKPRKMPKTFGQNDRFLMEITYTPDFYFRHKDYEVYFDTKGKPNDAYPIKKKMFLKLLNEKAESGNFKCLFFEPHNSNEINRSIEILLAF